jgi:hypothetical protein
MGSVNLAGLLAEAKWAPPPEGIWQASWRLMGSRSVRNPCRGCTITLPSAPDSERLTALALACTRY